MRTAGRAWVYGDKLDTDLLAPGYCLRMPIEDAAPHCLEALDPSFAREVREGDVFVAGDNLGLGSAREQAPTALRYLGIRAILAKSFARIFFRNAINIGLPALFFPQADEIRMGDAVEVDLEAGRVTHRTSGKAYDVKPLPPRLMAIVADGGLMPHLQRTLGKAS